MFVEPFAKAHEYIVSNKWDKYRPSKLVAKASKQVLKGGLADNIPDKCFDKKNLKKGEKVEREHTKNKQMQKEIAEDHLAEDPNYYEKLEKMEKKSFVVGFEKVSAHNPWTTGHTIGAVGGTALAVPLVKHEYDKAKAKKEAKNKLTLIVPANALKNYRNKE